MTVWKRFKWDKDEEGNFYFLTTKYKIIVYPEKLTYVINNMKSGRKYRPKREHTSLRMLMKEMRERLEHIGIYKTEKRLRLK